MLKPYKSFRLNFSGIAATQERLVAQKTLAKDTILYPLKVTLGFSHAKLYKNFVCRRN